jgi:signal transduction histidine kinase
MSVSTAGPGAAGVIRGAPAPISFRLYSLALFLGAALVVSATLILSPGVWRLSVDFIPWVLAVALAGALPIRTENGVSLAFDLPVLLAAGYVLGPAPAGLAALLGTVDLDEIRGRGSLWLSLYNRAQTALAAMAAALVFHALGAAPGTWPAVGLAAILGLLADAAVNYSLVAAGVALFRRINIWASLSDLRIGAVNSFALEYGCFGLLGLLLAETYIAIGIAGLVIFIVPLILSHQMFHLRQRGELTSAALQAKTEAINSLTHKIADERRDERLAVAGELHDEVLPPLFKVHLMGQVVRQDLASGRLLNLDEDVPDLLHATDAAQQAVRGVVSSLRRSPVGPAGLIEAIRLLAAQLEGAGGPRFVLDLEAVDGSEHAQLLAYQVLREAMNNAARHSRAAEVTVVLRSEGGFLRTVVTDDGIGFASETVDRTNHFGLQLMRERIESAGGSVVVDTRLGHGTCVSAAVPMDA